VRTPPVPAGLRVQIFGVDLPAPRRPTAWPEEGRGERHHRRANSAHMRQSRPGSDCDFQVKVLKKICCFLFARKRSGVDVPAPGEPTAWPGLPRSLRPRQTWPRWSRVCGSGNLTTNDSKHNHQIHRAIAVKVAAKRLPVSPFSGLVKGCKGHKMHRFENGGTNQIRKTGKREIVWLQPLPQSL